MTVTPEQLIRQLNLQPLPNEGGYYAETYRAEETLANGRATSTAIYYLLTADCCSKMHRLKSDEIWHFYLGDPAEMLQLAPDGSGRTMLLGRELCAGQQCQMFVP